MNLPKLGSNNRGSNALVWIIVAGIAIIVGGIAIGTTQPLFSLPASSAEAQQVDSLFRFMLSIGGMIFLLVEGVLVYSILRFRAKAGDISDGPPIQGNTTLELVWTVIPAIIVVVLTLYSFQVWTNTHSVKPNELAVNAQGARFAWTFSYPITEDTLPSGVTLADLDPAIAQQVQNGELFVNNTQLHTWVNRPVFLSMTTQDVNHAFWVPAMRVKQDLIAGRTTQIRFTPIEAGPYRIVCAELCGSGHGAMAGEVVNTRDDAGNEVQELVGAWLIVHATEEDFLREFYDPAVRAVLFPPEDPALRGRALLESGVYPCATCHVLDDLGWVGVIGPNLNGIGDRAAERLPSVSAQDYLHQSLRLPYDYLVPGYGALMPQFNDETSEPNYMPEEHLNDIIAYLLTQTANSQ